MPSSWAAWSPRQFGSTNPQASPLPPLPPCASKRAAPNRPAPPQSPALNLVLASVTAPLLWIAPAWPPSRRTRASTPTWTRRLWRRRSGVRGGQLSAPSRTWRRKAWWVVRGRCCSDCTDNTRSTPRRRSAEGGVLFESLGGGFTVWLSLKQKSAATTKTRVLVSFPFPVQCLSRRCSLETVAASEGSRRLEPGSCID